MNNATGMNTSLFNMSEMWTIPITGAALQMRPASFVPNFGPNRQVSADADSAEAAGAARKRREKDASEDDSAKAKGVCTAMSGKRLKISEFGDDDDSMKADGEDCSGKGAEQDTRAMAKPPKDCIHVRARRGQATDSHSLAERARREKISERMRVLQDLVPGCNKVIGKALVLDEIINYIQSLQHQVEFLSMKLEAVNSRLMPGIEAFPADFGRQAFDASGMAYGSQIYEPLGEYGQVSSPEWSNMQLGGGV